MGDLNKYIHVRASEDDLNELESLKLGLKMRTISQVVRQALKDEKIVMEASQSDQPLKDGLINGFSGKLSEALAGVSDEETRLVLRETQSLLQDIKAELKAILSTATHNSNNINQISRVLNQAAYDDPSNADVWDWILQQLADLSVSQDNLDEMVKLNQQFIEDKLQQVS